MIEQSFIQIFSFKFYVLCVGLCVRGKFVLQLYILCLPLSVCNVIMNTALLQANVTNQFVAKQQQHQQQQQQQQAVDVSVEVENNELQHQSRLVAN